MGQLGANLGPSWGQVGAKLGRLGASWGVKRGSKWVSAGGFEFMSILTKNGLESAARGTRLTRAGFWPHLGPKCCKLQYARVFAFWGPIREPSVPYNWTCGAFGTCVPLWSQPGPGEVWSQTPQCCHDVARGGSQSLRESRRAPRKKTWACIPLRCFFA